MSNLKNPAADDAAVDIEGGLGITYRPFQCASGKYGLLTILVALLLVTGVRADEDASLPDDPYASYLLWPHFHFSGTFRCDVSTVNNLVSNYNMSKTRVDPNRSWQNPRGSAEWSVISSVTQVCYANGTCLGKDDVHKDKLIAAPVHGTDMICTFFTTSFPGSLSFSSLVVCTVAVMSLWQTCPLTSWNMLDQSYHAIFLGTPGSKTGKESPWQSGLRPK